MVVAVGEKLCPPFCQGFRGCTPFFVKCSYFNKEGFRALIKKGLILKYGNNRSLDELKTSTRVTYSHIHENLNSSREIGRTKEGGKAGRRLVTGVKSGWGRALRTQ